MPKKPIKKVTKSKKKTKAKIKVKAKTKKPAKSKAKLATSSSGDPDINKQLDQLSSNQIDVLKMMNDYNSRLAAVEIENQKLFHVLTMVTKNQDEFKGILDMLGRGTKMLKRQIEDEDDGFENDSDDPNEYVKKDPPLHDDVTATCGVCDKVFNSRLGKCPRCGFTGEEEK